MSDVPLHSFADCKSRILFYAALGAALACAVLLTGCGGGWWPLGARSRAETRPAYPDAKAYACAAGKRLLVQFGPANKYAMVIFPDREFRLDAQAPDGTKFSNGRTELSFANGEAKLEEGGTTLFANCKPERAGEEGAARRD